MTLDGFCDHTAMMADDELHDHYTALLRSAGAVMYGRITYQLMENYWPLVVRNPTGNPSMDEFALSMQDVPKIVFSRTLKQVEWDSARLAKGSIEEEILALKQQPGKDIFVGSPGLIVAAMKLNLVDEYQLCVHPVIAGRGLPLFNQINERVLLTLINTKTFGSGAILLCYEPKKE